MRTKVIETTVAHKVFEAIVSTATLSNWEISGAKDKKSIMALSLRIPREELQELRRKELTYTVIAAKYKITKEQLYLLLKLYGLVNPAKRSLAKCQKSM